MYENTFFVGAVLFNLVIIYYFRMGCGSSTDAPEGPRTVVVFGATGLLGSSVARALLEDPFRFKVKCVTRRSSSDKARKLAELGMRLYNTNLLLSIMTPNILRGIIK